MKEISICWEEEFYINGLIPIYYDFCDGEKIIGFLNDDVAKPLYIPHRRCCETFPLGQPVPLRIEDVTPTEERESRVKPRRKITPPNPDNYRYNIKCLYKYKGIIFNDEVFKKGKIFAGRPVCEPGHPTPEHLKCIVIKSGHSGFLGFANIKIEQSF